MAPSFIRLNSGWNAEPNAPYEELHIEGLDVRLSFKLNPFLYKAQDGERAELIFSDCATWRLGPTNDHGWWLGQCRYSKLAPEWGEFYEIVGDDPARDEPTDWHPLTIVRPDHRHFLFYLRDKTFECLAMDWRLAPVPS